MDICFSYTNLNWTREVRKAIDNKESFRIVGVSFASCLNHPPSFLGDQEINYYGPKDKLLWVIKYLESYMKSSSLTYLNYYKAFSDDKRPNVISEDYAIEVIVHPTALAINSIIYINVNYNKSKAIKNSLL